MKTNSIVFTLSLILSFGVFASTPNTDLIIKQSGEVIEGDIAEYMDIHRYEIPEMRAIDSNYKNYFKWNGWNSTFMNISGTCKVLVVNVTSGKGYNQNYHHKEQPFESFQHPPYHDPSTWVRKVPVVAMDCNDTLPGIEW